MLKRITIISIAILMISSLLYGCSFSSVDVENYEYKPSQKTNILSSDDELIREMYDQNSTYVKLENMPKDLVDGIIAVEDSRFYKHKGYDPIGIIRAMFTNIKKGEISEGASTITQQLARNLFKEITTDQTLLRKINEALTARQLEKKYTKEQILEMYLNEIYLGSGTYGVQEASKEYFGKEVSKLSLAECAMLAGLPQAPSAYAPDEHIELAKKRQNIVIDRMVSGGYISKDEAAVAKKEEIIIIGDDEKKTEGNKDSYSASINRVVTEYKSILQKKYPQKVITRETALESIDNDGLNIYTTINSKMQEIALASLEEGLQSNGLQNNATGSFVTVDAETGAVLTYYGGNTDIDMANKPRQPGSSIKPLIYSKAFEEGLVNPNSIILDEPTTFNGSFTPKNADNSFRGYLTIREAIVNSINIPAVKVMEMVGINKSVDFIKEFGVTTIVKDDYGLTTALGGLTKGVSPLEMAKSYGVFANEGVTHEVYFIKKITDSNDNLIYQHETSEQTSKQVIKPETANVMKSVLNDVVNRGTATGARTSYVTGGKTGTTTNNKDLWFVGFTGKYTTSVWIGNLENKSINGRSSYCAKIYGNYMKKAISDNVIDTKEIQKINTYNNTEMISILSPSAQNNGSNISSDQVISILIPSDQKAYFDNVRVVGVEIDSESGKLFVDERCPDKNKEYKYYIIGQEPIELCDELHFFDKIQDIFSGNSSSSNSKKNKSTNENTNTY